MAACKLAAAVAATAPFASAGAAKNSPGTSKSIRGGTPLVGRGCRAGIRANSFSQSEFLAESGLSAAVSAASAAGFSRSGSAMPLSPVCKVNQGDSLPTVSLKDQDGKTVTLSVFKGKPLVLYFYPADGTPGCTKQACAFRDSYEKFKKAGAEVVGVSSDNPASHRAFRQQYRLPFTLLSDEGNKLRKDWGVPSDFFGTLPGRQTYVFDKSGTVKLIFNNQFQPEKHVDETLKILKGM